MNHWDVVLREVFLVPPALLADSGIARPGTIDELAALAGIPVADVRRRLAEIDDLQAEPVEVTPDGLAGLRDQCLADGRQFVEMDAGAFQETDFLAWLAANRDSCVVVRARDMDHAWSAAMYLRSHGVPAARALKPSPTS